MVDPELFARYQKALSTNADLAKGAVEELLARLDGLTPLEQAEMLMAEYPKLVRAYGKVAADVARQYYQESRDAWYEETDDDVSDYSAQPAHEIEEGWAYEDIQGSVQSGIGCLPKVAVRRTMQRADETIALNVRRDSARGRWAVVPHPGACGWCILIAGNGWAYSEQSVNAQRHDGCKCAVAVDFDRDKPSLAGYDPRVMQQAYADAYDTVEGDLQRRWNALPEDKRAKYLKRGGRGFDGFRRDQIVAEMNCRDREWLRTGKVPEVVYEKPRSSLTDHERKTVDALQAHGFRVVVKLEDGSAAANIDLAIGVSNIPWEMKNVGNGKHAVEDRMEDSDHKWTRLGLDPAETRTVMTSFDASRDEDLIIADIYRRMYYAAEVLYITRSGGIRRIAKQ